RCRLSRGARGSRRRSPPATERTSHGTPRSGDRRHRGRRTRVPPSTDTHRSLTSRGPTVNHWQGRPLGGWIDTTPTPLTEPGHPDSTTLVKNLAIGAQV